MQTLAALTTAAPTTAPTTTAQLTTAPSSINASDTNTTSSTTTETTSEEVTADVEEVTADAEEVTADDEEVTWKMTTVDHVATGGVKITSGSGKTGPTMDTYTGVTNTGETTEEPTVTPKEMTTEDSDPS